MRLVLDHSAVTQPYNPFSCQKFLSLWRLAERGQVPACRFLQFIVWHLTTNSPSLLKANKEPGDVNYDQVQAEDENICAKRFE